MTGRTETEDVAGYAERVARHVPGLAALHRMTALLLAERVPEEGRVLVLGAGGGLETKAMAEMRPGWRFDGVDPSSAMIGQAKAVLGADARRVTFHEDTIDVAPPGPVDGATALLVLHFLERAERLATLRALADRLAPGAPLVVVHHSFPRTGGAPDRWLERNAALLAASGVAGDRARSSIAAMRDRLPVLDPAEDEALLAEAGFAGIELFYAAFTFKGWVGYRA